MGIQKNVLKILTKMAVKAITDVVAVVGAYVDQKLDEESTTPKKEDVKQSQ